MGFAKPESLDMTEGDDIQSKITKPITPRALNKDPSASTHPTKKIKRIRKKFSKHIDIITFDSLVYKSLS